jgi:hypothetical protein
MYNYNILYGVVLHLGAWAWGKHRQSVTPYEKEYTASAVKSLRMRCAEHVARMGKRDVHTWFRWGGGAEKKNWNT